jgi:hypothetical protein
VFNDLLENFEVEDADGESSRSIVVESIYERNEATTEDKAHLYRLECLDEDALPFSINDPAHLSWIDVDNTLKEVTVSISAIINRRTIDVRSCLDSSDNELLRQALKQRRPFTIEKVYIITAVYLIMK